MVNIYLPRNQKYGFSTTKSYHRWNFKYVYNLGPVVYPKTFPHPLLLCIPSEHAHFRLFALCKANQHKTTFRENSAHHLGNVSASVRPGVTSDIPGLCDSFLPQYVFECKKRMLHFKPFINDHFTEKWKTNRFTVL